nr:hypothetical protein [Tanacetum cinerariifolium]
MSTSTFAETHNLIVFLKKHIESDGFEQIVDFLNANLIKYALTRKDKTRRKQRKETKVPLEEPPTEEHIHTPSYDPLSNDEEGLGDQEDASKQGRSIANIDQDKGVTLVDDTQGRMNEEDLFKVHDLSSDEVFVDVTTSENIEQDATVVEKEVSI